MKTDQSTPQPHRSWWKRFGMPQAITLGIVLGVLTALSMPASWFMPERPTNQSRAPMTSSSHEAHTGGNGESKDYWACPMFCTRMDAPGECPVCGMTLERFEDTGNLLPLGEPERLAMGLRSEEIERRELAKETRTVGMFRTDESQEKIVAAWVDGRIEKLYADFTGVPVEKGWHLFDLYSPALYSAQKELLIARDTLAESSETNRAGNENLLKLAREKLELLGLTIEQVIYVETLAEPQLTLTIPSPAKGIVLEKMAHQGMYLKQGQPVYRIANLDHLWLMVDVHERDLSWISLGQQVSVEVDGLPGRHILGRLGFIDPVLNIKTRTVSVRVEVENASHDIRPGMYGTATIFAMLNTDGMLARPKLVGTYACPMHPLERSDDSGATCPICGMALVEAPQERESKAGAVLAVPRQAVLSTGRRHVVYVETLEFHDQPESAQRMYQMFEVELGPLAAIWHIMDDGTRHKRGEYYPVLGGLNAGMRVVTNGQFLIDSQMELSGKRSAVREKAGEVTDPHAGMDMGDEQ